MSALNAGAVAMRRRFSKKRERIYGYLCSTGEHPTAEMVYEELKGEIPDLSLGTVYRNLKVMEGEGKIRRVATVQNAERYDARCDEHVHFVCTGCGCVKDVPGIRGRAVAALCRGLGGFAVSRVNVTLEGLCPECAGNNTDGSTLW